MISRDWLSIEAHRFRFDLVVLGAVLFLCVSCGAGGELTAGVGGSGIGGTGITTVSGNIASVDGRSASLEIRSDEASLVILIVDQIIQPVNAQTSVLEGIQVSGGGRSTSTDANGVFSLAGVDSSDQFELLLGFSNGQQIPLAVGTVAEGATVVVNDIIVSTAQGSASASGIEVQNNSSGSDDNASEDSSSSDDDDSTDDVSEDPEPEGSEDDDSEEPDEPGGPEDPEDDDSADSD